MVSAFVLVKIATQLTHEILPRIKALKEPLISCPVMGKYDMILHITFPNPALMARFIVLNIRELEGVSETLTFFVLKEVKRDDALIEKPRSFKAFVFVKLVPGASTMEVAEHISKHKVAALVSVITGEYDIGVFISADSMEEVTQAIFDIRMVHGVQSTETFMATG